VGTAHRQRGEVEAATRNDGEGDTGARVVAVDGAGDRRQVAAQGDRASQPGREGDRVRAGGGARRAAADGGVGVGGDDRVAQGADGGVAAGVGEAGDDEPGRAGGMGPEGRRAAIAGLPAV